MMTMSRSVQAGPLDDGHIGGVGHGSPTTGDLTAVSWNPGALGLLQGTQALVVASVQSINNTVARAPIDPASGAPGGARTFPEVQGGAFRHPATWPPASGSFLAVGAAIGNRFTLALAAYTPFAQRVKFDPSPSGELPTRFHVIEADLRNFALVPALALRIGNHVRVGAAPGFLFSTGRLVFDEDTAANAGDPGLTGACGGAPCGAENDAAAARYDVGSEQGLLAASPSFTVGGGVHIRIGAVEIGAAFASRPYGNDGGGVRVDARRTSLLLPQRLGGPASVCPPGAPDPCLAAELSYALPDIYTLGATWHLSPRWDLVGFARWLTYGQHQELKLRIVGPASGELRAAGLPEQVVLHRGLRDVLDTRVRAIVALSNAWKLAGTLRVESPAATAAHVSAANVDGWRLEPALAADVRVGSWLRLRAGYAFTFMLPVDVTSSAFDPQAAAACANAGGDLDLPACRARLEGRARASTVGRYEQLRHNASLSALFTF